MKKLIWSAYALSLLLLPGALLAQTEAVDDFLGLETEVLPELKGEQRFTTPELNQKEDWQVTPEQTIIDLEVPHKGQGHSIIPWEGQDPEEFLSISKWILEREIKDVTPDWKLRVRQSQLRGLFGKVLQCRGSCSIYRGSRGAKVQHLSRVLEGDELRTGPDTVAWVYLMDGTLIRLSAQTSVSFQELNFTKTEVFFLLRLNQGHVFWHPRGRMPLQIEQAPETDSLSLPLMVRDANRQFFEREQFQKGSDRERVAQFMDLEGQAVEKQVMALNSLIEENNLRLTLPTKLMMVAPNGTLVAKNVSLNVVHQVGGESFFKRRLGRDADVALFLRGYAQAEAMSIKDDQWYSIGAAGRSYAPVPGGNGTLQLLELLTRRIRTIELARERWVQKFTLPVVGALNFPDTLAQNFGYTVWGEEANRRFQFLIEYTRRVETTNLRSVENLLTRLEASGEAIQKELPEDLYRASLNHYLLGLKSRYDKKNIRVREFNDLKYYVWILTHGKF